MPCDGWSISLAHRGVFAIAFSGAPGCLVFPFGNHPGWSAGTDLLIYGFEDYLLDPDRRELRRGVDLVGLEPLVFDLLQYLIRNRDRVASKDDLIASVWRGRIVSESTLTSRMNAARHAVGDSGQHQRLIRTIPRKGFRFVGEVCERAAAPLLASEPSPIGAIEVTSALDMDRDRFGRQPALAVPDKPSIAVLPFLNLSGDPGQDYFADGTAEDITVALARLPQLFVIGGRSAVAYKNRPAGTRQIGAELGVRYLLQGSVRRDGDTVRINVQLSDSNHGGNVWAERFEGKLDSVFALQDRVASNVATMIAPAVRTAEIAYSARKPTTNSTAYDLFLRASEDPLGSLANSEASLRLLYRAIELDPRYGAAYGLAAYCIRTQKVFDWISPEDPKIAEGTRLAQLAFETGKNDSEAMSLVAGSIIFLSGDLELARVSVDRALSLNPNSPNAWWASGLSLRLSRRN